MLSTGSSFVISAEQSAGSTSQMKDFQQQKEGKLDRHKWEVEVEASTPFFKFDSVTVFFISVSFIWFYF